MSDKMRWRYGDTNPVVAAVDPSTVIKLGDLLFQAFDANGGPGKAAYPAAASSQFVLRDERREFFADNFLGVAMQRSPSGHTDPIRVATTGVFEFDCPSGTSELGDLVGVDENADGDGLLDQQVAPVLASQYAIGRVAKRVATAAQSVLVDIRSAVMTGGILTRT